MNKSEARPPIGVRGGAAVRRGAAVVTMSVGALAAGVLGVGCTTADGTASSGTTGASGGDAPVAVTAAFSPIAEAAERVGGDCVQVTNLTPPGTGPHDLELDPQAVQDLERADVVLYLSRGFQPQVEEVAASLPEDVRRVDLLDGLDLLPVEDQLAGTQGEVDGEELADGTDPHVWVDPVLQRRLAERIHEVLVEAAPQCRATFDAGLAAYGGELGDLDQAFASRLATCETRAIVTSHRAFAYLAQRYDLDQIAIAGISPDAEPDPQSLEAVAAAARDKGVRVVYFEEQVPPDLAETVAREIGAETDALDPVETITADDLAAGVSYASIMEDNLDALAAGLGCS